MTRPWSVRLEEYEAELLENALKSIEGRFPDIKGKRAAINRLVDLYNSDFKSEVFGEIPPDIESIIAAVGCNYLQHDGRTFQCYQEFYSKKKSRDLGPDPRFLIVKCEMCDRGHQDKIKREVETVIRKKTLGGFLDLREELIKVIGRRTKAQIFICKSELADNQKLIISADGLNFHCPLDEGRRVSIQDHCYQQVDPNTINPPCQYLVDPHVSVMPEPPDEARRILRRLEQQIDNGLEKPPRKEVNATQEKKEKEK